MKKILKNTLFILLVSTTLVSCFDEYLEPTPAISIDERLSFDTRSRILGQVNGLYRNFKSGAYLGGRYLVYNDIKGDDFLNWGGNGVTGLQTWKMEVTPSTNEVQNCWQQIYIAINTINVFLEGLDANKDKAMAANQLTEAEYNQYKGEALALRGLAYFHLLQLYARPYNENPDAWGAILRLKAQKTSEDNWMKRSTVRETYAQILVDLNTAETLLPTKYYNSSGVEVVNPVNDATKTIRIHINTVIAIKTRVYLHMSDYANVIAEGNKIAPQLTAPFSATTYVRNGLSATYSPIFSSPYTTNESIFSMPMTATELPGTQNGLQFYHGYGEYTLNVAHPFWANNTIIAATDARKLMTGMGTGGNSAKRQLRKFTALENWIPVIRYAEVLLNIAEAEARLNGVNARAVALLNAVYIRSNSTATPFTIGSFASVNAFITRLMQERQIEFIGEGIRNMDICRMLGVFPAKGTVGTVNITSSQYVWPIPQSEINTNLEVQPNP